MLQIAVNIIGFILSTFLGSVLVLAGKVDRSTYLLSAGLLFVFSLLILNSLRILVFDPSFMVGFEMVTNYLLLLIGPILYLLIRSESKKSVVGKKDLWHFLPFFILFPIGILAKFLLASSTYFAIETFSGIFLIISLAIYLIYSLVFALRNRQRIPKPSLYALVGFTLIWHANLVVQSLEAFTDIVDEEAQIWATLLLSFLVVVLSYSHWIKILKELNPIRSKLQIKPKLHQAILRKVEDEMTSNQAYLLGGYSLQDLSKAIGEPSSYISKVINKEKGFSFPIYISSLRVQEFVRIAPLPENSNLTIQGIAEKVGFKSSSTFNKAFKQHMGMLPSEFLKTAKDR